MKIERKEEVMRLTDEDCRGELNPNFFPSSDNKETTR